MSARIILFANKYKMQNDITFDIQAVVGYSENITGAQYSPDAGSTWYDIDMNPATLTYSGSDEDDAIVNLAVTPAIQAVIFTDGSVNDEVYFRLLGSGGGSVAVTLSAVEFEEIATPMILPNNTNTNATDGNQFHYELHSRPLHSSESINVIWDVGGADVSPTAQIHIYLRWDGDGEQPETGYTDVKQSPQAISFGQGHYTISSIAGYQTGASGRIARVLIRSASDSGEQIYLMGKAFAITHYQSNDDPSQAFVEGDSKDGYPSRTELFSRVAAEKAMYLDEVPTISQIEAGKGIIIRQRDYLGKKVNKQGVAGKLDHETLEEYKADSPEDRTKAYNLVIDIDPTTLPLPELPRVKQGYINFNSLGDGVVDVEVDPDKHEYQYGTLRKYTIYHNWNLGGQKGVSGDPRANQTHNSYLLQFMHVQDDLDTAPNYGWDNYDAVPVFATYSRNAIEVYCNVKKSLTAGQVARGAKDDDEVFKPGDELPHYVFEWRLTELIP